MADATVWDMGSHTLGAVGRFLLVGGCALAALASATPEPGERASQNNDCDWGWECPDAGSPGDNCPEGETCSPDTPYGLYFGGAPLGDSIFDRVDGPQTTAVGGVQTITVFANSRADPFTLPFDAAASSSALEIAELAPPAVRVRATEVDSGTYLRILEPGTDLLYDRISLAAEPVASVGLSPAGDYLATDIYLPADQATDGVGLAVLAGATSELVVTLNSSGGWRLVDEEIEVVSSSLAGLARDPERWDVIRVAPTAPVDGRIKVTAGDGIPHPVSLRVVAGADDIRGVEGWFGGMPRAQMALDHTANLCFRATNQGDAVLGASWSYAGSDRLAVGEVVSPLGDREPVDNCVEVTPLALGDAALTVSASGATVVFLIEVVAPARAATRPSEPEPPRVAPNAGERAQP